MAQLLVAQFKFDRCIRALAARPDTAEAAVLPVYGVGHSLGSLVQLLISIRYSSQRAGNALMSFNNKPLDDVPLIAPFLGPASRVVGPLLSQVGSCQPSQTDAQHATVADVHVTSAGVTFADVNVSFSRPSGTSACPLGHHWLCLTKEAPIDSVHMQFQTAVDIAGALGADQRAGEPAAHQPSAGEAVPARAGPAGAHLRGYGQRHPGVCAAP